jgi:hypothetical protein
MIRWDISFKATGAGALSGSAIGLIAFFFLTSHQHPAMGAVLFLLVPVVAGFSVVLVARRPNSTVAAALLSVLSSLVFLIALGKEGVLCAVMAFPLIAAGLAIGTVFGLFARHLFVSRSDHRTTTTGILLLIGPTLILGGEKIETPSLQHPRIEVIQTSVQVNDSPEKVWDRILSIDSVEASKPLLMYIGLPIPQRCSLRGHGVGSKRTCYFNSGYIEETVTAWNPPYHLGLTIDRAHMAGRNWLGFESAEYNLQANGDTTLLTRTTVISSRLHPASYWRRFERLGVESEHRYILDDLRRRSMR